MLMMPVRDDVEVFALTEKLMVPGPAPDAPDVRLIHGTLALALRGQSAATPPSVTVLAMPPAGALRLAGGSPKLQPRPAWLITNARPAMVRVAERPCPVWIAALLNDRVPLPEPEVAEVNVTQSGAPVTLQLQPAG